MSASKSGLVVPRRRALLGAAATRRSATGQTVHREGGGGRSDQDRPAAGQDRQIAAQTEYLANGTYLALEERGNKIMGQPAELVWLDEPSPQGAHAEHAEAGAGEQGRAPSSAARCRSNALAEEATAAQLKIPFVCDNAAATEITGKNCNRYTFRLNTPVRCSRACWRRMPWGTARSGTTSPPPTRSARTSCKSRREHPEAGRRHRGRRRRSAAEHRRLQLVHPEDPPGEAGRGARRPVGRRSVHVPEAMERAGHEGQDPVRARSPSATPTSGRSGQRRRTALFTKLWWYNNPNNPPEEKAFADAYMKKHGKPAADKAWMGWITAQVAVRIDRAAKSTEPRRSSRAGELEGAGRRRIRTASASGDHQMLLRNLVGVGEAEDHRQVGLLRREGDAAREPGGPGQGVRHAGGNRLQDGPDPASG